MAKTRIIPGVQVAVIKEVVPPQLSPSGVLGLIGITENIPETTERAASWNTFIETFGPASAYSMPDARQAIENGVFELVVCPTQAGEGEKAFVEIEKQSESKKKSKKDSCAFILEARAAGPWANQLKVKVRSYTVNRLKNDKNEEIDVFDLEMQIPHTQDYEKHRNLTMDEGEPNNVATILQDHSSIAVVKADSMAKPEALKTSDQYVFTGGKDASATAYIKAVQKLINEPDVDMVLASIQDITTGADKKKSDKTNAAINATNIYSTIISHCNTLSEESKGRIGFGQIPVWASPEEAVKMVEGLNSDRFVLLAPCGVAGAVAGMIGGLNYFHSPTFKTLSGLGAYSSGLGVEEQRTLLRAHVVPVVKERGRGIIVLRGLTTDGDQISVRRVADRAVRGVKMIGELFIGRLNTEDGRNSLKQKLVEFLMQMEKENAIVPSTDGTDPAFKINVYSSQADFAQGIVRIDMAVRPVRAIDFIYATVLVQV